MKVRAAAWYQGWGKGQTCEQMYGENVSSSCYRRQKRSRDDEKGFENVEHRLYVRHFIFPRQCFAFVANGGENATWLSVVKGQMQTWRGRARPGDYHIWHCGATTRT